MAVLDTIKTIILRFRKRAGLLHKNRETSVEFSDLILRPGSIVVVTGVNGLIGSHIADQLVRQGYTVRGTVRNVSKERWMEEYFEEQHGAGKFELVEVPDIVAVGAFDEAVKGASGLVHTATPVMAGPDPHATIPLAVDSTLRSLESAAREPTMKRVVITSSSGAVTCPTSNKVFRVDSNSWNEDVIKAAYAPPPYEGSQRITDVYCASKTRAEQAAWQWMREHKCSFVLNTVLPSPNFGPPVDEARQGYRSTLGWIKAMFDVGIGLSPEDLVGLEPYHFIDVRDCAALHVAALVYADVSGERLLGFAEPFNWNDIVRVLKRLYPDREFGEEIPNLGTDMSQVANERAEDVLKRLTGHGWTSLEDSLRDTTKGMVRVS
ncbi:NAD(P)-binding protein [Hypomontagnella monticulosa]|nr:NAD(P)-binding protein [Hypomontagnella monticulosa]